MNDITLLPITFRNIRDNGESKVTTKFIEIGPVRPMLT